MSSMMTIAVFFTQLPFSSGQESPMTLASEDIHKLNKREAFDGMRAYHQSEIFHKKDCIDILKSILTSTLAVYGSIIGLAYSEKIQYNQALSTACIILFFTMTAVFGVVWSTNKKIDQDNMRYGKYRDEYKLERLMLRLEEDMWERSYISAWFEPHDVRKTGYHHTKVILRCFGWLIIGSASIGTMLVLSLF
jgi:hypothetical protein